VVPGARFGHRCCEIRAVSAVACVVVALFSSPCFSPCRSVFLSLSLSPACRQCGTQAGPRPASLRARVSKPFEFEAPVNSLEFSPLLASRAALPRPYRCSPRQPIPFHCPSSSHQHEAESLLPAYLLCPPGFSFLQPPFGPLSSLLFTIVS